MAATLELITRQVPSWVIDRIEEGWAVLENASTREVINVPLAKIPEGAKPGDTLINYKSKWLIDLADTRERAKRVKSRFDRIKSANSRAFKGGS